MNEEIFRALIKFAVKEARAITDDQEALEVKCLYKEWEKQIGRNVEVGEYIQYEDKLYRVLQAHTVQETWKPGVGTESLYVVIDKEHEGTIDDPIPFVVNMEVFEGKYYTEDDILYVCTRDSGIALQQKASELVGIYFEVYTEEQEVVEPEQPIEEVPVEPEVPVEDEEETSTEDEEIPIIDEEPVVEEGTLENPIDVTNIALPITYELDKYYKEEGVIYKCTRAETLYYLPSALVGVYFEIA